MPDENDSDLFFSCFILSGPLENSLIIRRAFFLAIKMFATPAPVISYNSVKSSNLPTILKRFKTSSLLRKCTQFSRLSLRTSLKRISIDFTKFRTSLCDFGQLSAPKSNHANQDRHPVGRFDQWRFRHLAAKSRPEHLQDRRNRCLQSGSSGKIRQTVWHSQSLRYVRL